MNTLCKSEILDKNKPYYYIDCGKQSFQANSLARVMELWCETLNPNKKRYKPLSIGKLG